MAEDRPLGKNVFWFGADFSTPPPAPPTYPLHHHAAFWSTLLFTSLAS